MIGKILNRKIIKGKRFYLIKWRDYPSRYNSWEPKSNLKQAWDLIEDYDRELDSKKKKTGAKGKKGSAPGSKSIKLKSQGKTKKEVEESSEREESSSSSQSNINDDNNDSVSSSESKEIIEKPKNKEKTSADVNLKNLTVNLQQTENYPAFPSNVMKLDLHLNGKLTAQVKWENDDISSVNYENFKKRYPIKLLDFFESRIIFPFDNEGTKKFQEMHKLQE